MDSENCNQENLHFTKQPSLESIVSLDDFVNSFLGKNKDNPAQDNCSGSSQNVFDIVVANTLLKRCQGTQAIGCHKPVQIIDTRDYMRGEPIQGLPNREYFGAIRTITENTERRPVGIFESYFRIMNNLGISNYKYIQYRTMHKERKLSLQGICFGLFSSCAVMDVMVALKSEIFDAVIEKKLASCVRFGFSLVRVANRGFFLHLVACHQEKISIMLMNVQKLRHEETQNTVNYQISPKAVVLASASVILTVLTAIFGYSSFSDWTLQHLFGVRTFHFAKDLFLWNTSSYINDTDQLFEKYYHGNISILTVCMGSAEGIFQFCGTLQGEIIRDLLIIASFTLLAGWQGLEKMILSQLIVHPNNEDDIAVESCLKQYKMLRHLNESINDALGTVLNYVIIQNLFLYAYFFVQLMTIEKANIWIIHTLSDVIKATVLFYISLKVHWTNDNIKKWHRLLSTYKYPDAIEKSLGMTHQAAMDDLTDNNIGLGTGYFLLNESFLVGFFAAVASIISFLVESQDNVCRN